MRLKFALAVALFILTVTSAFSDTLSDGIKLIEEFSAESDNLLKGLPKEGLEGFLKKRSAERQRALDAAKTLRWSEEPGMRRYRRIRKTVEDYAERELASLRALSSGLSPWEKTELERRASTLSKIKADILQKLDESFEEETIRNEPSRGKEPHPVPSVDVSPFEERPGGGTKGIWER